MEDVVDSRLWGRAEDYPHAAGLFDRVFLDAWKPDYKKYLEVRLPMVRSDGVTAAHNVESHANELQDFLQEVKTNPQLKPEVVRVGSAGLSISYKE